ncbi:ADP-ribosylation/Crystallin J1 [Phytophthora cactorum]|nr:ADP-ribosylation/Crystallin J1 [Phytophthora cactorum]
MCATNGMEKKPAATTRANPTTVLLLPLAFIARFLASAPTDIVTFCHPRLRCDRPIRLRLGLLVLVASSALALLVGYCALWRPWPELRGRRRHHGPPLDLRCRQDEGTRGCAPLGGPEFYEPPSCPFYSYESGALSPYGDEIFPLLQDVAERGEFVPEEFAMVSYRAAKAYTGRLNSVFKEMVVKGDAGKKYPELASPSKDLHGGIKAPILAARYFQDTAVLLQKTREAARVHEVGAEAEDAAVATALLIQQVVQGASVPDAVGRSRPTKPSVLAHAHLSSRLLTWWRQRLFGCYSCRCSLRQAMLVACRAIVIGAITAAAQGGDAIPAEWKQKTNVYAQVLSFAEKLLQ